MIVKTLEALKKKYYDYSEENIYPRISLADYLKIYLPNVKDSKANYLNELLTEINLRVEEIRRDIAEYGGGFEAVNEESIGMLNPDDDEEGERIEDEMEKFELLKTKDFIASELDRSKELLSQEVLHSLTSDGKEKKSDGHREVVTFQNKIHWQGTETQFVYLFEQLVKAKLLNDDFLDTTGGGYSLLAQHFENRNGKPFKNTQLANTFQNLAANKSTPGKPKGADKIDKVISKTKRKK